MTMIEFLKNRRSARKFLPDPVRDEDIRSILEVAMSAPSESNSQPWRFVVIQNRDTLLEFAQMDGYAAMAADAPLGILVCGDEEHAKHRDHWIQACSACMENILLAAEALGYGALWCGIHLDHEREHFMRTKCALPDHIMPLSVALIGKSAHPIPLLDRYDPHKVHYETW